MTRRRNLVQGQDHTALQDSDDTFETQPDTYETSEEQVYEEQYWDEEPAMETAPPRATWAVPVLAALAATAWTIFFAWVNHQAMIAGAPPSQWIDWIVEWSVPLVLIAALYLLGMRNSRREANRFTDAARSLAHESSQLESRLLVVNRELALARDFIEAQSRDLETLGRLAVERLSTNADRLQDLIHDNTSQIDNIGHVSEVAVANMGSLRDQLPVLTNAARDMNNQIGAASNSAEKQIEDLLASFEKLHGLEAKGNDHVERIGETVRETLKGFEDQLAALGDLTSQRLDNLRSRNETFLREFNLEEERVFDAIASRSETLTRQLTEDAEAMRQREAAAATAMRERIVTLRVEGERLVEAMDGGQAAAAKRWTDAIDALEERMKRVLEGVVKLDESAMTNARIRLQSLNEEAQNVDARLLESMEAFETDFEKRRAAAREREDAALADLEDRLAAFDRRITERQEEHLAHVAGLAERGEALAGRLASLDDDMQQLGAQADDAGDKVAGAADRLAERLSESRAVLDESGTVLDSLTDDSMRLLEIIRSSADYSDGALSDAVAKAEKRLSSFGDIARDLHALIKDTETRGSGISEQLEKTRQNGRASVDQFVEMEERLKTVSGETERVAERTAHELRQAIEMLSTVSAEVLDNLRNNQASAITDLAENVAVASREKLAEAMRRHTKEAIGELEEATSRADAAGRDTAGLLRDELSRVNELAANLESRIQYARERAEEQVDSEFAKRMALITEALNSSSIDIAKAFDNDIGDTQWAHYLRGDRGIFTRRAVRLLDKQEARQISGVYTEDADFRDVVNRYIHDFEAMLRGILATRDGNAMAVTLLSSDMGKLYVALAQAIDRLRD